MGRVLPILFNTDMVRAVLDGKSVTRRSIKKCIPDDAVFGYTTFTPEGYISCKGKYIERFFRLPFQKGDILYVRETFKHNKDGYSGIDFGGYIYKADCKTVFKDPYNPWTPSIHMPKEAARIWLKVTDVRVERLHDITDEQILKEGISEKTVEHYLAQFPEDTEEWVHAAHWLPFKDLWNSTVKKSDFKFYSWDANPWVWVIEFERCEKPSEE